MQFVSLGFLAFLPICAFIYFILPQKVRYIWLFVASWGFYYVLEKKFLILLAGVCIATYLAGLALERFNKKLVLTVSIVVLVVLLFYYKYTGFMQQTINRVASVLHLGASMEVLAIALPIGISFYIFQAIGYVIDCYRGTIKPEKNPLYVALFISFFPQIMAGPIERAGNMIPQYKNPRGFDYDSMRDGLMLMLWGYFQKIIIADRLAIVVNHVYGDVSGHKGTMVFIATLCYTMQIYCDFAGYSNIAIGTAKILGISLMENFRHPYLSGSVAEFWRNWHISLSSWFRDYLYIPLGGNRKGYGRKLLNLMIVFAVSGLWHGAAWTFVMWGILHGLYQVVGILMKPFRDKMVELFNLDRASFSHRLFKIVFTFMLVNIGWVFFRADTFKLAVSVLKSMWHVTPWVLFDGTLFNVGLARADVYLLIAAICLLLIVDICNLKGIILRNEIYKQNIILRWAIYLIAAIFIITCGVWGPGYDAASFIYSSF